MSSPRAEIDLMEQGDIISIVAKKVFNNGYR